MVTYDACKAHQATACSAEKSTVSFPFDPTNQWSTSRFSGAAGGKHPGT
jgi:hypothetical protein